VTDTEREQVAEEIANDFRTKTAERLFALVFELRQDDGPKGQSWCLNVASIALARAILGHVGPKGDAEPLLELAASEVRRIVEETQATFIRDQLTGSAPGPRRMH
jgi:hypothetical protein